MNGLDIRQIPVLNDNYVYLARDEATGQTVCVDPAVGGPVVDAARGLGWDITHVLITHPHYDHTDGVPDIVDAFGAKVWGAKDDFDKIPKCDHAVVDGDVIELGKSAAQVLGVPGHTAHHVAYYFKSAGCVFVGDTLFSLGCGRLLGGTPAQMWASLKKLRALPATTQVYCAHEYTNANADFALSIDPDNADLKARAKDVLKLRESGQPTVPSALESELRCNPFLRCDDASFQSQLGMTDRDAEHVFAKIRSQKDNF